MNADKSKRHSEDAAALLLLESAERHSQKADRLTAEADELASERRKLEQEVKAARTAFIKADIALEKAEGDYLLATELVQEALSAQPAQCRV